MVLDWILVVDWREIGRLFMLHVDSDVVDRGLGSFEAITNGSPSRGLSCGQPPNTTRTEKYLMLTRKHATDAENSSHPNTDGCAQLLSRPFGGTLRWMSWAKARRRCAEVAMRRGCNAQLVQSALRSPTEFADGIRQNLSRMYLISWGYAV